jgi:hypothetical protein
LRETITLAGFTLSTVARFFYNSCYQEDDFMKRSLVIALFPLVFLFSASLAFAQAFGEYGRAVGSVPHGQGITGGRTPGGVSQGGVTGGGVGDVGGGRALPTRLVVASKSAGLYPRQDGEAEKIDQLSEGEFLVPMVQAAGGSDWYMVKTQKGLVGWVKGADVREEKTKK